MCVLYAAAVLLYKYMGEKIYAKEISREMFISTMLIIVKTICV